MKSEIKKTAHDEGSRTDKTATSTIATTPEKSQVKTGDNFPINLRVINEQALQKFQETYSNIPQAFLDSPGDCINYLRVLGFRCVGCGGVVTSGNLKFYNYSSEAKCYECQNIKQEKEVNGLDYKHQVDALLESRSYFISKVLPILHENQDYFTIMGKKSLAKGGAEKLATIFNLSAEFSVDKDTMELLKQEGLVAYVCNLKGKDGQLKGQGRGADILARNRGDANKTIKMAQKRAFVDAVIRTTSLSDIFTQDLEDISQNGEEKVDSQAEIKMSIKKLCDQLTPGLKIKEEYEAFVKKVTALELVPENYQEIINRLDITLSERVNKHLD